MFAELKKKKYQMDREATEKVLKANAAIEEKFNR